MHWIPTIIFARLTNYVHSSIVLHFTKVLLCSLTVFLNSDTYRITVLLGVPAQNAQLFTYNQYLYLYKVRIYFRHKLHDFKTAMTIQLLKWQWWKFAEWCLHCGNILLVYDFYSHWLFLLITVSMSLEKEMKLMNMQNSKYITLTKCTYDCYHRAHKVYLIKLGVKYHKCMD